jgi:hypothetical protein
MTDQSDDCDVAEDLDDLGIANWRAAMGCFSGTACCDATDYAVNMTYDGVDPEFADAYDPGDRFLPPSVRVMPLKPTKDAAAYSVQVIDDNGYDDQLGVVAFATNVAWTEQLTMDYDRIHAKIHGIQKSMPHGTSIHAGIGAARIELESSRARPEASKVMVLMTDGNSNAAQALTEAQLAVDAGITIFCIGLGTDVDQNLLDDIANLGGGEAVYIDNVTDESVYGPQLSAVFVSMASRMGIGLIQ